jgi:hypothetical protein
VIELFRGRVLAVDRSHEWDRVEAGGNKEQGVVEEDGAGDRE